MPVDHRPTPSHRAWLLPLGTVSFMLGILIGQSLWGVWPAVAALALSLPALALSRHWKRTAAALMAALSFGAALSWQAYHPTLPAEGEYLVRATVADEIDLREQGQVQTILTDVTLNGKAAPDGYWTYYLGDDESLPDWLVPGAQVALTAKVYHPEGASTAGGFDFKEYLLQRGVKIGLYGAAELTPAKQTFSLRGSLATLRHTLSLQLMDVMGEEAGAYASAMLLGTKNFLPDADQEAFRALGIAHLLAVSGFHVGVLAGMIRLMLKLLPIGRKGKMALEAAVLLPYCGLTGGNAPVLRASGMLLWREYTPIWHRQLLPLHLMCITALIQLLLNPTLLKSASFQLTYGAILGLLLVFPWLSRRLHCRNVWLQRLWEAFCAAFSAQLGILAPQLYWFGELPLLSILLNMVFIPIATLLMLLYWVTLFSLPMPFVRSVLGALSAIGTHMLVLCVRWAASLELSTLWLRRPDGWFLAGWTLLLLGLSGLVPPKLRKFRPGLLLLGVLLMLTLLVPQSAPDVTYTQMDAGDADAAILQDQGMVVVIDTGDEDQTLAGYLHQRQMDIDLLILSHLHIDHVGGVQAILDAGISVETCYIPWGASVAAIDEDAYQLIEALEATGTVIRTLQRGDVLTLPSGTLTVLWPEATRVTPMHDANDASLVLHADIAGVTMLLTGDLTGLYEHHLQTPADILKVAHHGSSASTSEEFLAAVQPQVLLLSNADEKREIRMAELAGEIPLYSTAACGTITVTFLGNGSFTVTPYIAP